jgi:aspartate/glutamate racemase
MKRLVLLFGLLASISAYANFLPDALDIHPKKTEEALDNFEVGCSKNSIFSKIEALNNNLVSLFSSTSSLTSEKFVSAVLQKYAIEKGKDASHTHIVLRLHPRDWEFYFNLQQEIAKLLPEESKRPTIDLTLTATLANSVETSIGISGGTGPLSDSELLKLVMRKVFRKNKKMDWNKFAINLYSAPPPRTTREELSRGVSYLEGMTHFATRGHNKYFLASNTAHSKIGSFKELVWLTRLRENVNLKKDPVVDLADYVAGEVAKGPLHEKQDVLVLGTLKAYREHLYPKYLDAKGFENVTSIPDEDIEAKRGQYYTLENLARAEELQKYIDLAKEGKIEEAGEKVKDFIVEEVKRIETSQKSLKNYRPIKIILGCTELPMALRGEVMNHLEAELRTTVAQSRGPKTGRTRLEKRIETPIHIFNTERLFSDKISDEIKNLVVGIRKE